MSSMMLTNGVPVSVTFCPLFSSVTVLSWRVNRFTRSLVAGQINRNVSANAAIGGGGAGGTTTQNVLPWAWSSTADSFLIYGADEFRPLTTSEYAAALGGSASDNVLTTGAVALSGPPMANSLVHTSSGAISGVVLNSATREFNVTNRGTTTIGGVISPSTANLGYSLAETGAGRLDLTNAANTYDGTDPFTPGAFHFTNGSNAIENTTPFTAAGTTFTLQYNVGGGNAVVSTPVPSPSRAPPRCSLPASAYSASPAAAGLHDNRCRFTAA